MKNRIMLNAIVLARENGLTKWSIDELSRRAHCAKGLVLYHYKTKAQLLLELAGCLRQSRRTSRQIVTHERGTQVLDDLWRVLEREVTTGEFAAWLGCVLAGSETALAARVAANDEAELAQLVDDGLEANGAISATVPLINLALDGFQMRLLQGASPLGLRDAYDAFWLSLLP